MWQLSGLHHSRHACSIGLLISSSSRPRLFTICDCIPIPQPITLFWISAFARLAWALSRTRARERSRSRVRLAKDSMSALELTGTQPPVMFDTFAPANARAAVNVGFTCPFWGADFRRNRSKNPIS